MATHLTFIWKIQVDAIYEHSISIRFINSSISAYLACLFLCLL